MGTPTQLIARITTVFGWIDARWLASRSAKYGSCSSIERTAAVATLPECWRILARIASGSTSRGSGRFLVKPPFPGLPGRGNEPVSAVMES